MKKRILLVDDDQSVLDALRRALRSHAGDWSMDFVGHPERAWEALLETAYDAVVTDVKMPGIGGLELLDRIRANDRTKDVPVVVLTGLNDRSLKGESLDRGADDLLSKPIDTRQLVARLRNVLRKKSYEDDLRQSNRQLAERVQDQVADITQSRMSVICRLRMAAEYRDEDTGNHVIRVGCYSRVVAAAMGMPASFLEMLLLAAPLHDIGKIGIPDSVLLKPGALDADEWEIMKQHCRIGERILRERSKSIVPLFDWYADEPVTLADAMEHRDPMLDMAATVALTHHEKWDGGGYPQQLAGEAIPLESRIVAIADVFDALTSNRPYHPPRPEADALAVIESMVGRHFDPRVHAAFVRSLPEIRATRIKFGDDIPVLEPGGVFA